MILRRNGLNYSEEPESSPIARGRRVKRLRVLANLDRKDVEERYGINHNTLKGWELGRHGGITEKGAKKIIALCQTEGVNCELNWILHALGLHPSLQETPPTSAQEHRILQELLFFRQNNANTLDYAVQDDAMAPYYSAGDYVAGIKCEPRHFNELVGLCCIVQGEIVGTLLCRIEKSTAVDKYRLVTHATTLNDITLSNAAEVIWHRRKGRGTSTS